MAVALAAQGIHCLLVRLSVCYVVASSTSHFLLCGARGKGVVCLKGTGSVLFSM